MAETHERRQCSVCGEFWPADVETCPLCPGMRTFEYTITIQ